MDITNSQRAAVLVQALPYIQEYRGKIIVVQYGGNAWDTPELKDSIIQDIVLLSLIGVKVVLVHGGSAEITDTLTRFGKESTFIDGLRVTDRETVDIIQMVLSRVSNNLINLIETRGGNAIGLTGLDGHMIETRPKNKVLGFVGDIMRVNVGPIKDLIDKGYVPVITPIGSDKAGNIYSINPDTAAARIAGELGAESLISLTDIRGILTDIDDPATLIPEIKVSDAPNLIQDGTIHGGMVQKVEASIYANSWGVRKVFIIDGRVPHALLIETLTAEGIGTMFVNN